MSDNDEKDLKDEGDDEKTGGAVLSDSVLDAFDETVPAEVEDDLLKDPFETNEEGEDDDIPFDSGDFNIKSEDW